MNDDLPKPAPMSLAWDFLMYNVSVKTREYSLFICLISFNVVVW